jgi:hypothetical protein
MTLLANPQRQAQSGHQGNDFQHRRIEVRAIDQAAQIQAVEQPLKLIGHIAVVDVDRHGTDLAAGEKGLQILGAVVELDADVVAPSYATRTQRIAQLIGSLIELLEAELLPAAAKGNAIRHSLHHQLKNIRQIEGPCHLLSPSVFPFYESTCPAGAAMLDDGLSTFIVRLNLVQTLVVSRVHARR